MKSITSENNDYFSFTHQETAIEVIWEFNKQEMSWSVLVYKDQEKEISKIAASSAPTSEKINEYDLQRLSEITLKMTDFLSKRLKLESKPPISK
jgi:hypothetical protein